MIWQRRFGWPGTIQRTLEFDGETSFRIPGIVPQVMELKMIAGGLKIETTKPDLQLGLRGARHFKIDEDTDITVTLANQD